jgi:hypothetical protein
VIQESFVSTRKQQADPRQGIAFTPMATVKSDQVIEWTKSLGIYTGHPYVPKGKTKFSPEAGLRFSQVIDNFVNIMSAIAARDPSIIAYRHTTNNSIQYRRPVQITLTMPTQMGLDDEEIKQHCLEPFLDNLVKHHDVKLWIWKAEAQLRGCIHFHVIIDRFLEESVVRELWYNRLLAVGIVNRKDNPIEEASKISYLSPCPDLSLLKLELGSYYAAKQDEKTGALAYKHDHTKLVRQIKGRAWGSCDRLKYKQLTLWNPGDYFFESIGHSAIKNFPVMEEWTGEEKKLLQEKKLSAEGIENINKSKRKFADCHLFKMIEHPSDEWYPFPEGSYCHFNSHANGKDFRFNNGGKKKVVISRDYDDDLLQTLHSYHYLQACKTYGTGINTTDKTNRHFSRVDEIMISGDSFFSVLPSGKKEDAWVWNE